MSTETRAQLASFICVICKLLSDPCKRNEYRKVILPLADGRWPNGSLIVTRDHPDGGIDSVGTSALITKIGGR